MKKFLFLLPIVALLLSGCGGGSGISNTSASSDSTGIPGVWDAGTSTDSGTWDKVDWQ